MTIDEDPYYSEEYSRFVEAMAAQCHCIPLELRPCDGVLAGGVCDGLGVSQKCTSFCDKEEEQ